MIGAKFLVEKLVPNRENHSKLRSESKKGIYEHKIKKNKLRVKVFFWLSYFLFYSTNKRMQLLIIIFFFFLY